MSRTPVLVFTLAVLALAAALMAAAARDRPDGTVAASAALQPTDAQLAAAGLARLPLAPDGARVDLTAPTFSNPTEITNPLFPIGDLRSAVLNGRVDGKAFHIETTLLPETRIIQWTEGQAVEARISQYVAFLDGHIEEVALDYYAQADDGSVWYLGEDVFNYDAGVVADLEGTWLAGRDAPPAMIMPAQPRVGDVYRPENAPGLVFEEVTIKAVDRRVRGPHGAVTGAIVAGELHQDGTREDKTFAPGYGEFFTGSGSDVEAMALAVPADALDGPVPPALLALSARADEAFAAVLSTRWKPASAEVEALRSQWRTARDAASVPPRIATEMRGALRRLDAAVRSRDLVPAGSAAFDVARSTLDLRLRYEAPPTIDRRRFELWTRRLLLDVRAGDVARARGDVAALEWVRDRFAGELGAVERTRLDTELVALRSALGADDLHAVAGRAKRLARTSTEGRSSTLGGSVRYSALEDLGESVGVDVPA